MEIITFEKEAYYKMMEELIKMMHEVVKKNNADTINKKDDLSDLITTTQALKLLGLKSKNWLYELRNSNHIEYYQYGRRVLYSKKSILDYLEAHKVN